MIVYRLARAKYKNDLSGEGAAINGARWNEADYAMLYTAEHISLAMLESLVHFNSDAILMNYFVLKLELPEFDIFGKEIVHQKLGLSWKKDWSVTQFIGTSFLKENKLLFLKVPSVIVPEEFNVIINPNHPQFKKIKLLSTTPFDFDGRLLNK